MAMTETVRTQILAVRGTGKTNMLDVNRVKRIAGEYGYNEMIEYVNSNTTGYTNFILYGDESGQPFSRRVDMFTEKEKRALQIKAVRLVTYLQNIIDGINPEQNAVEFDADLDNFVYDYEKMKKAKR